MCGIAGVFNLYANKVIRIEDLKKMTNTISHRGPDDEGTWKNDSNNIGLGHRRLSILDLTKKSSQPMHFGSRYSIVYNGEIYNYLEIKESLTKKGVKFTTTSDTEVLLHSYIQNKEKCLDELDGMFSFAIWDNIEKTIFLARDRFGEKPLYYSVENGQFIFSSEMKAIWSYRGFKALREDKLIKYVKTHQIVDQNDLYSTYYENISEFPNGHYLIFKRGDKIKFEKYWELKIDSYNSFEGDLSDAISHFKNLLITSIKRRMRSDVTLGSSLSGGLDSSTIVELINQQLKGTEQTTFSAKFPGFQRDESSFIDILCSKYQNLKSFSVTPDVEELKNNFRELVHFQEEPFGSSSIYAQWCVMKLAKNNKIKVMLDGQGADEFLAGYLPYYKVYLNQLFWSNKRKYREELNSYNELRRIEINHYKDSESFRMKLGRLRIKFMNKKSPINQFHLKQILSKDLSSIGLRSLLRYADRNAMAHSVETRLPFLNHELIEFVFTLPDSFLLKDGWTKFILRKSMEEYLPPKIIWRKEKVGFETPQEKWLKSEWVEEIIFPLSKKLKIDNLEFDSYTVDNRWSLLMYHFMTL